MNNRKQKSSAVWLEESHVRHAILLHGEELAAELNLCLLLEADLTEPLLYVEQVTVTDIRFPERKAKTNILAGLGNLFGRFGGFLGRLFGRKPVKQGNGHYT